MKKLLFVIIILSVLILSSCQGSKPSSYSRLLDDYIALSEKYDNFDKDMELILSEFNTSYIAIQNKLETYRYDLGRIEDDISTLYVYFEDDGNYKDARDAFSHLYSVLKNHY